jgi:hypothetical protein
VNRIQELKAELKWNHRKYRVMKLKLRKVIVTKRACEDSGYLPFYPEFNKRISYYLLGCKSTKKELRATANELRDLLNFEKAGGM